MDNGWRRNKYGGLFNINDYINKGIRNNGLDNVFVDKDGKVYEIKRNEEYSGELNLGHIGLKDNGIEAGWLEYVKVNDITNSDKYKLGGTRYKVFGIKVEEQYRKKGLGTKLYQEFGKITNYEEVFFGSLTEDGKKLVDKVATITRTGYHGPEKTYFGKINRSKK